MSIMKFAVCSRSSTASRSPPNVIRGTLAVAALPMGFTRRSRILFVSLTVDGPRIEFVEDDADQFPLRPTERGNDVFHAVVDIEIDRKDGDEAVGDIDEIAVGRAPRHRRSVENDQVVAAGGARLLDRVADGVAWLDITHPGIGALDGGQDRDPVSGLDGAGGLAAN